MTITLPEDVRAEAEARAKALGFATVEEYVIDLIRDDELGGMDVPPSVPFRPKNREALERLLDEGIASGNPVVADEAYWRQLREKIRTGNLRRAEQPT